MSVLKLHIGCDLEIPYEGFYADGAYQNGATVTYTIKDRTGATVPGGTGTCSYIASSDGNYLGVIESTVTVLCARGQKYTVEIAAAAGAINDFRVLECKAVYRGES